MRRTSRGFTLVEILVVMTLLSLVMLGMASAMRTMADTETRVDTRLARTDKVRTIERFLSQVLGRVSYQRAFSLNKGGSGSQSPNNAVAGDVVRFEATSDSISWVGIMPARPSMGGRYFFRLAAEQLDQRQALVLRYLPWSAEQTDLFPDWSTTESEVVVRDLTSFTVEAQADRAADAAAQATWSAEWRAGWSVTTSLPERLRLRIADASGEWPLLIVPVRVTALSDKDADNGFAVGGGGAR